MIHQPSMLPFIPNALSSFVHLQQYISTFVTWAIYYSRKKEDTFITKIFHYTICLNSKPPQESGINNYFLAFLIVHLLFSMPSLFMYMNFTSGTKIQPFFLQTHGLLFLFFPTLIIFPLAVDVGSSVYHGMNTSSIDQHVWLFNTMIIILMVVVVFFSEWASPLMLRNPLFSDMQFGSRLLGSNVVTYTQIFQAVSMICGYIMQSDPYFPFIHVLVSFWLSIRHIKNLFLFPYLNDFDTFCSMGVHYAIMINPVLCWICIKCSIFNEACVLTMSAVLIILCVLITAFFYIRGNKSISYCLRSNYARSIPNKYAIRAATVAVMTNTITDSIYSLLDDYFSLTGDYDGMLAKVYCEILSNRTMDKSLVSIVEPLLKVKSLSWRQKFIVYQFYQYTSHTNTSMEVIPELDVIHKGITEYNRMTDKFWDEMLKGDTTMAVNDLLQITVVLNKLIFKFNKIYSFYPSNQEIIDLEHSFFSKYRPLNEMCEIILPDWVVSGPQLKTRHAKFLNIVLIDSEYSSSCSETASVLSEYTENDKEMQKISKIMQKFGNPSLSHHFTIMYTIFFIVWLSYYLSTIYPVFKLSKVVQPINFLPNSLTRIFKIAMVWSNMAHSFAHLSNCTHYALQNRSEIKKEVNVNAFNAELTLFEIIGETKESIKQLHQDLRKITIQVKDFTNSIHLQNYKNLFMNPTIFVSNLVSDNQTVNYLADIKTILGSSSVKILNLMEKDKEISCDSLSARAIKSRSYLFFNMSANLEQQYLESIDHYFAYIDEFIANDYMYTLRYLYFFGFMLLVANIFQKHFTNKIFYNMVLKHFRPQSHPNPSICTTRQDEVSEFKISKHSNKKIIYHFLTFLLFSFIYYFFFSQMQKSYSTMLHCCQVIVSVVQASLRISIATNTVLRSWQFNETKELKNKIIASAENIIESQQIFMKMISLSQFDGLRGKVLPDVVSFICNSVNGKYLHDSYECMPLTFIISLYANIIDEISRNETINLKSPLFAHMQHIYIMHIISSLKSLSNYFSDLAERSSRSLMSTSGIIIIISTISLISYLFLLIDGIFKRQRIMQQLSRFIIVLPPRMIVQNDCILSYLIKKEDKSKESTEDSLIKLYERANVPLILITANRTIVTFTKSIQEMFGYNAEQIIGQSIELLLPKINDNRNETKFYHQLQIVLKKQAEPCFQQDLIGVGNDGRLINIHSNIMLTNFNSIQYFLIEMYSYSNIILYEDLISHYIEKNNEVLSSYLPSKLFFDDVNSSNDVITAKYRHSCLVFAECYDVVDKTDLDNFDAYRHQISMSLKLMDGSQGAFVLEAACTHALILFVDYNDSDDYLKNAIEFYFNFNLNSNVCKSGFLAEGGETEIHIFPLSDVPEEYKNRQLDIEDTNQYIPTMTVETTSPIMEAYPNMIHYLKQGLFFVTKIFLPYIESSEVKLVGTESNGNVYSIPNP